MKQSLIFILFLGLILSCKNKKTEISKSESEGLPADFVEFYDKFHSDSVFQIEHCLFPMEGLPDQADSTLNSADFRWTADNWRTHKHIDEKESGMTRRFLKISDKMITETLLNEQQGIGMERRFAKFGDDWNLIYYVGMNQFRK